MALHNKQVKKEFNISFESYVGWNSLKEKQRFFCKKLLKNKNILLTGGAGFGKSFVLNFVFNIFDQEMVPYGKTASTGIAAINIGGSTIHSWAGMGLANTDINDILKFVFRNKKAVARIKSVRYLFIDEASMLSGDFIDKLDKVCKIVRKSSESFGGINLILIADVLQLPPIFKTLENKEDFFFDSSAYKKGNFEPIVLTELVRQDEASEFAKLLNEIRVGEIKNISLLSSRINKKIESKNGIEPVRIFCRNVDVNKFNELRLNEIDGKEFIFYSKDFGLPHHIEFFNKNCQAPEKLVLKIGAQVMLLKNIDTENGLVNGSIGVVEAIVDNKPLVKFKNDKKQIVGEESWEIKEQLIDDNEVSSYKVVASRTQIPLKLCWGITVHKCQGQTLDSAEIDLSEAFESGMVYVALSRVRNLESLSLKPFSIDKIKTNQKCLDFWKKISDDW